MVHPYLRWINLAVEVVNYPTNTMVETPAAYIICRGFMRNPYGASPHLGGGTTKVGHSSSKGITRLVKREIIIFNARETLL